MNHNKLLFKYLFYYYLLCIQKDIYTLKFFQEKNKVKFQKSNSQIPNLSIYLIIQNVLPNVPKFY
jgi:hypothetical protein